MEALQPIILIAAFVAIFYFLAIRPQRRRQQDLAKMQQGVQVKDEVVTMAGIYGTVTEVEEGGTLLLEVSENTEIRIAAASIAQIVSGPSASKDAIDASASPE